MARGNGPKTKQNHIIRVSKNKAELKLEQDKTNLHFLLGKKKRKKKK